jgi:uncharacterized protein (DUF4415 family)
MCEASGGSAPLDSSAIGFASASTLIEAMTSTPSVCVPRPARNGGIMKRKYDKIFSADEVKHLERSRQEMLEKLRRLPDLSDEEEARIVAAAESDPEALPLSDSELARMRPMHEAHPEFLARWLRRKRGRPPVDGHKKQVTLRLDQEVIDHFRSGGPGWQTRINDQLRRALRKTR